MVAESILDRRARDGGRRRARRQRIAGPALPDQDIHLRARRYPRELDIGAVGKSGVSLDLRTQHPALHLVERVNENHTVRIAHRHGRDEKRFAADLERHLDHVAVRPVHRDLGCREGAVPHLDRDEVHTSVDDVALALHAAALGVHGEDRFIDVAMVPEVLGEDAEPVPGLLRLASVGIQDAESEGSARPGGHLEEDPVGAHAPVAVADAHGLPNRERGRQVVSVDDDIVVAEPVSLDERDHAFALSRRRAM